MSSLSVLRLLMCSNLALAEKLFDAVDKVPLQLAFAVIFARFEKIERCIRL